MNKPKEYETEAWEGAQKWASQQPNAEHEAKMKRIRNKAVQKMNNVAQLSPTATARMTRNSKGGVDL